MSWLTRPDPTHGDRSWGTARGLPPHARVADARDPVWDAALLVAVVAIAAGCLMVLATGHVATLVFEGGLPRYPLADAPGILWRFGNQVDNPGRAWDQVNGGAVPPGPVAWWSTLVVLAALVSAPFVVPYQRRRHHTSDRVEWAHGHRLGRLRVRSAGSGRLVVGRAGRSLIAVERRHSLLVFGPTESGKTSGLAIPAILEWPGPVVATSTKGDLVDDTIAWRSQLGEVHIFDPAQTTRHQASGWSPLATAGTWKGARRAGWDLAMAGKAAVGGSMSLADFWFNSAAKSLAPYLLAAARSGSSMADVARWIDGEERDEVLRILRPLTPDAVLAVEATFRREERARSSLFQVMQQILGAYFDPDIAESATRSDINPAELLNGSPSTLYVTSPYLDQERLRPLFSTIIRQVIASAYEQVAATGRPLDPPLLLVLDEAANIAPVEDLATVASTAAAMGVQLVTVFQDLAQVKVRYGDAVGTVVNNHRATLFLPGIKDLATLELASGLIGEHEIDRASVTVAADGRRSNTTAGQWRQLLPGAGARTMADGTAVLVYGNLPPVRLRLRLWFRSRRLRKLAATPFEPLPPSAGPPQTIEAGPPRPPPPSGTAPETVAGRATADPAESLPPNVTIFDAARARLRRPVEGGEP